MLPSHTEVKPNISTEYSARAPLGKSETRNSTLDLQHLKTFVVMVSTSNFTRAAKELGCSQSTVTLHIQLLERELGSRLFERNKFSKTNTLTAVGQQVFEYAVRLLALADEVKTAVENRIS